MNKHQLNKELFFFFFFDLEMEIYTTHTHTLFGEGRRDSNLCQMGGRDSLAPLGQMPTKFYIHSFQRLMDTTSLQPPSKKIKSKNWQINNPSAYKLLLEVQDWHLNFMLNGS